MPLETTRKRDPIRITSTLTLSTPVTTIASGG